MLRWFSLPCISLALCTNSSIPCFASWGPDAHGGPRLMAWELQGLRQQQLLMAQVHARRAVQSWLQDIGGTHVDTANDYRTQVQVGEALKASGRSRQEVFITTKCPGAIGFNATVQCIEDNLQMLGFYGEEKPYIDLVLVHFPFAIKPECIGITEGSACQVPYYDPGTEVRRATWAAMEFALHVGRVRAIGVSNYEVKHLMEISDFEEKPAVNQVEWHPFHHEDELKAFCDERGIAVEAWSPLSGQNASALSDPTVKKVAAKYNVSTAQVVLRWSIQQNVTVVVGTEKVDHMKTDLEVFSFQLTDAEMHSISKLRSRSAILV
eukprot:CAMPEP_0114651670 /NCGR_PEP_ID=MMETSP0191-20121206/8490_1 /TAXON_ID=126664 /ORGANISM="Sorites sp." /LENGTH=321 /DNA_ID=CAMNT_0001865945 /DNA_START=38 /DNA_END=1004 /DNA_ORIENTATION=+